MESLRYFKTVGVSVSDISLRSGTRRIPYANSGSRFRRKPVRVSPEQNSECERTTSSNFTFDGHLAFEGAGQVLHDRQAESRASDLARACFVGSEKTFEYSRLILA